MRLGAGLAYYGLFAIVPLLALIGALAGVIFSRQDVQEYLAERLERLLQGEVEQAAAVIADQISKGEIQTGLGTIGAVTLLISGSLVFVALQDALNVIWDRPVGRGLRYTVTRYALGFSVVLVLVAVIIVSMAVQAVSGLITSVSGADGLDALTRLGASGVSWALGACSIALLFRVLTGRQVPWRIALKGGVVTGVAVVIGTWAIGWYLNRFATASFTGAAGALSLILVWIYYEAQILLAGAQLTKVLDQRERAVARSPEQAEAI